MKKHSLAVVGVLFSAASLAACGAEGDATTLAGESAALGSEKTTLDVAAESAEPAAVSESTQLAIEARIQEVIDQYPDAVRIDERTLSLANDQVVLELVPMDDSSSTAALSLGEGAELGQNSEALKISLGFNIYVRLTPNDRREVVAIVGAVGGGAAGATLCARGTPILQAICGAAGVEIGGRVARAVYDRYAVRQSCGLELRYGFSSGVRFIRGDSSQAC